jgi:hypothetical protein
MPCSQNRFAGGSPVILTEPEDGDNIRIATYNAKEIGLLLFGEVSLRFSLPVSQLQFRWPKALDVARWQQIRVEFSDA